MIIWDCADGFVAEIENDDDFNAFLNAFTANDDVKRNCHDDDFDDVDDYDDDCYEWNDVDDYDDDDFDDCDDYDYDDCDYEVGYNPYMGCFDYDC